MTKLETVSTGQGLARLELFLCNVCSLSVPYCAVLRCTVLHISCHDLNFAVANNKRWTPELVKVNQHADRKYVDDKTA